MRWWRALVLVIVFTTAVHAHPLAPCLLEVHESGDGRAEVGWKTPLVRARGAELEPVLPSRCHEVGARRVAEEDGGVWTRWTIECGPGGLVGEQIGIAGPGSLTLAVVVRVTLVDGRAVQSVLSSGHPMVTIPRRPRPCDVVRDYGRLGIEHILYGADHLLFVFGLVLLSGTARRLLGTVGAFTVGHSITSSLAALGIVALPSRLIEVAIATSVLALAVELARRPAPPTLVQRQPWMMAVVFGLLHGLGFAGALREAGLPVGEIPLALLSFNAGIEVGQIAFVLAVLAPLCAARRLRRHAPTWLHHIPVYGMGSLAGYWWLARAFALLR